MLLWIFHADQYSTVKQPFKMQHLKGKHSQNEENVILKIIMGRDNVIYWHIFQHTFNPQQQDVPSAYNTYISQVFYGI